MGKKILSGGFLSLCRPSASILICIICRYFNLVSDVNQDAGRRQHDALHMPRLDASAVDKGPASLRAADWSCWTCKRNTSC